MDNSSARKQDGQSKASSHLVESQKSDNLQTSLSDTSVKTPQSNNASFHPIEVPTPIKAPKSNFRKFLKEIRKKAKNEREKGTLFERAIRDFLKQSPEHSFEDVWMRKDWPELKKYGFPLKDLGIDLIAKEKETGRYWAIQCKCFDESYQVNKPDIDSFFTESGKKPFEVRLIVTTTNNWGPHALEALKRQTKECKVLDLHRRYFSVNLWDSLFNTYSCIAYTYKKISWQKNQVCNYYMDC